MNIVDTYSLTRHFGQIVAVNNLSISVQEGEIFGLIGPNGAGKTTTVRILCCLIRPSAGKAFVGGYEVGKEALKIREIVGLLPESPGLYGELSAYRNLEFYAKLYGMPKIKREENIERFLKMLNLWRRRNDPVETFSKGMQQKLAIVRSMVHEPRVLFLDEPTAALAPESAKVVRDFILELKQERRTIFLCTHNLYEAERLCDRVAIVNSKLIAVGSPSELERKFGPSRTEIQLERVSKRIVYAVKRVKHVDEVEVDGNRLLIDSKDPEVINPVIVETIVKLGGKVLYVTRSANALEETYLKLVKESEA